MFLIVLKYLLQNSCYFFSKSKWIAFLFLPLYHCCEVSMRPIFNSKALILSQPFPLSHFFESNITCFGQSFLFFWFVLFCFESNLWCIVRKADLCWDMFSLHKSRWRQEMKLGKKFSRKHVIISIIKNRKVVFRYFFYS